MMRSIYLAQMNFERDWWSEAGRFWHFYCAKYMCCLHFCWRKNRSILSAVAMIAQKSTALSICSIVLLNWLVVFNLEAQLLKQATIYVKEPVFDFGSVAQGSIVKHNFSLQNKGNSTLRINRIIPGCGCTVGKLNPEVIEAGQTGTLSVDLDSTNFSGQLTKQLTLLTNDPLNERVQLTLKGEVQSEVTIVPAQVVMPQVIKTSTKLLNATQVVELSVNESSSVNFAKIKSLSGNFSIRELESSPKFKKIELTLKDSLGIGELRDSITVNLTGSSRRNSLSIPVFASVSGAQRLSQSVVSYGLIDPQAVGQQRKSVKLENFDQQPLEVLSTISNNPALTVSSVVIEPGKSYVIHLDLEPTKIKNDLRASVQIMTNLDKQPLILNVLAVSPPKV